MLSLELKSTIPTFGEESIEKLVPHITTSLIDLTTCVNWTTLIHRLKRQIFKTNFYWWIEGSWTSNKGLNMLTVLYWRTSLNRCRHPYKWTRWVQSWAITAKSENETRPDVDRMRVRKILLLWLPKGLRQAESCPKKIRSVESSNLLAELLFLLTKNILYTNYIYL